MDKNRSIRTFTTGENFHLQHYLGAHQDEVDSKSGYSFRVWAPNAQKCPFDWNFTGGMKEQILWSEWAWAFGNLHRTA